ncbi:hypothetical protein GCM10027051_32420 [Niabella terrae]
MNYTEKRNKISNNLLKYHFFEENPSTNSFTEETASSFIDIGESAQKIANDLIPKLYGETLSKEEVEDVVVDR